MTSKRPDPKMGLLGLGLDNAGGHVRMTRGENFHLYGGSQETHERMQESCIKFNERLARLGKKMEQLEGKQLRELASDCGMNLVQPAPESNNSRSQ